LLERSQEDALALERLVPKAEQQTLQAGADTSWPCGSRPTTATRKVR
jgi:hypothetical protein